MAKRSNSVTGLFGFISDENKVPPVIEECVDFLVDHGNQYNIDTIEKILCNGNI